MNVKSINNFLGNMFFVIAISKAFTIFLILSKAISNVSLILSGGSADGNYYETLTFIVAICELVLIIASVVMIFINAKQEDGVVKAYFYAIGAFALENLMPGFAVLYTVIAVSGLYIKAGSEVKKKNGGGVTSSYRFKEAQQIKKDTDWFFNDDNK